MQSKLSRLTRYLLGLLSLFVLGNNQVLFAQNGNGTGSPWKTGGNDIDDASHFIGTVNPASVVIKTNQLERARITATGLVGIGTATPAARLSVKGAGSTSATFSMDVSNSSDISLIRILDDGMVGIGTATPSSRLAIRGSGNTDATTALSVINSSGSVLLNVKDNGFTGIRTSSPMASLQINTGADADIDYTNGAGYMIIGNPAGANVVIDNNEIMARNHTNAGDPAYSATLHMQAQGGEFRIHNNLPVAQRVVVNNAGFVGIGTASPTTALDIHGTQSFDNTLGDKISLFDDRIGQTDMYGFGIDNLTLYYKSNGAHKWYSQTNPASGEAKMTLTTGGFLGLGTENPNVNLTVEGPNARMILRDNAGNNSENAARIELLEYAGGSFNGGAFLWYNGLDNKLLIGTKNGGVNENVMVINRSGLNVGIGTSTPDDNYRLSVNGRIRSKEVVVESGWSDYVFDEGYKLRSLEEVESFIQQNGHLPEIPSEAEVQSEGVSLGEMNSKLLMKIEELTLYLIQLKKENERLESMIEEIRNK